jgi:hypothetical protein
MRGRCAASPEHDCGRDRFGWQGESAHPAGGPLKRPSLYGIFVGAFIIERVLRHGATDS